MKKLLVILLLLFPVTSVYGVSLKDLFGEGKELFEKGINKGQRTLDDAWNYDLDKLFPTTNQNRIKQLEQKMYDRGCSTSPYNDDRIHNEYGYIEPDCYKWFFEIEELKKKVDEQLKQKQIEKKQVKEPISTLDKTIFSIILMIMSIGFLAIAYTILDYFGVIWLIKEFFKFILKLITYFFPKVTKFFKQHFFPRLRKILKKLYD